MSALPFGPRALLVFVLVPVLALVAGLLTMGGHSAAKPQEGAAGGGCIRHTLRYGVTDDPAEVARQRVFEARSTAVTDAGFYTRPVASVPTIHAASHGFVVVFYRPDLAAADVRPLRAVAAAGKATKAPVIVAPRRQGPAVVVLAEGQRLDCAAAGAAQSTVVRRFAASVYASLAA
jgi:hypothetical protein